MFYLAHRTQTLSELLGTKCEYILISFEKPSEHFGKNPYDNASKVRYVCLSKTFFHINIRDGYSRTSLR